MRKIFIFSTLFFILFSTAHFVRAHEKPSLTIYTYSSFASKWGPGPKIKQAFEKECGCEIQYISLDDGVSLLNRLHLEGKSTKADIVVGLDMGLISEAYELGLFAKPEFNLGKMNLPIDWKNSYFVPYDYGYFAFVYDKNRLKNPPKSFEDLSKGNYKLIIQDPRTSSVGQGFMLWVQKLFHNQSNEVFSKISPNIVTVTKGWSEAYGLFLKGEADLVLSYTTSPAYHIIAEGKENYAAALFEEGHYIQVETAGLIKHTKQKKLAQAFLSFLTDQKAQEILPTTNWMYPVIDLGDKLPKTFKELGRPTQSLYFNSSSVQANRKAWIEEWLNAMSK